MSLKCFLENPGGKGVPFLFKLPTFHLLLFSVCLSVVYIPPPPPLLSFVLLYKLMLSLLFYTTSLSLHRHFKTWQLPFTVEVGQYITLRIASVPPQALSAGAPASVFGLLRHENRMSVLNLQIRTHPSWTLPIKCVSYPT